MGTDLPITRTAAGDFPPRAPACPKSTARLSIPQAASFFRKLMFAGPGFLVAVGYMDPGNWATDLAGGSKYNYTLLSVIMLSNLMAVLLQRLAIKLGVATGRDLAQACRDHFSRPVSMALWVFAEVAIAACDLAEVIGSAIALNLLFHIPLLLGVCLTALDVLLILFLQQRGFRFIEALVIALIGTIGVCFGLEIFFSHPSMLGIAHGFFVPSSQIVFDPGMLYIAISILGATVMPHNLYLHSAIVQTRNYERTSAGKREAIKFCTIDSTVALTIALFVNAAILIVAAATFYRHGMTEVAEINDAYRLLTPLLGVTGASTVFALALLASGQNSTLTGTLAGQVVMEGFLNIRLRPWLRRLITRGLAIVPAVIVTAFWGESGTGQSAGVQPGDPQHAAEFRRFSSGDVYQRQTQDGGVREFACLTIMSRLGCRCGDSCAQWLVAAARPRLKTCYGFSRINPRILRKIRSLTSRRLRISPSNQINYRSVLETTNPVQEGIRFMNSFNSRSTLKVGNNEYEIYRLDALDKQGISTKHLPYSLRILLENLAAHRRWQERKAGRHSRAGRVEQQIEAGQRNRLHSQPRAVAGFHRRSRGRRSGRHARRDEEAGGRSRTDQSAAARGTGDRPLRAGR